MPGSGGTVRSSGGAGLLVTYGGNLVFGGVLDGPLGLAVLGNTVLTLESAQTYSGWTVRSGNVLNLDNEAALINTSGVELNQATLSLNNHLGLALQNNNRVNDAAPIWLRSGNVTLTGKNKAAATESLGVVYALSGANTLTATSGGGTNGVYFSADLTLAGLVRSPGAVVNFSGTNLGMPGNTAHIRMLQKPDLALPGVLGAWAVAALDDFAAFDPLAGVAPVGAGGFVPYDLAFGSGKITNRVATQAGTYTLGAGITTTALLRMGGAYTHDIAFTNAGDVLHLEQGGLLRSNDNFPTTLGSPALPGVLTAGGLAAGGTRELVVYNAQNMVTIYSAIQDPGSALGAGGASLALVKAGAGSLTLAGANSYTGGTTVSQGQLLLSGTAGGVLLPAGGVTVNAATLNATAPGQIAQANTLTLNNLASVTLVGDNTLERVNFNLFGANGTPNLTTGGTLSLTNATPISVYTQDATYTPTITGSLALAAGSYAFAVGAPRIGGRVYASDVISGRVLRCAKPATACCSLGGQRTFLTAGWWWRRAGCL